jgi:hypothetical protein
MTAMPTTPTGALAHLPIFQVVPDWTFKPEPFLVQWEYPFPVEQAIEQAIQEDLVRGTIYLSGRRAGRTRIQETR